MKRLTILYLFFLLFSNPLLAQDDNKLFMDAKAFLYTRDYKHAFPLFQELLTRYPENHNINYLIGYIYTQKPFVSPKAIEHLEKAADNIIMVYDVESFEETRAPIYTYLYLILAYQQEDSCLKAIESYKQFMVLHNQVEDSYTDMAKSWLGDCDSLQKKEEPISQQALTQEISNNSDEESANLKREIVTKHIHYTTREPIYGVQVGAYRQIVPIGEFYKLKNVEAFIDTSGMVRYVMGRFTFKSQAEQLLEKVKEQGYEGAFIVDINKAKRFSEEIIIVDNVSLKETIRGKVDFRVQVGAFREIIPEELTNLYLELDHIKEIKVGDLTVLTAGSFDSYEDALEFKNELIGKQIPGAFVVACNYNKKIDIEKANYYLNQNKSPEK